MGGTIQEMLEAELDEHLGYSSYERLGQLQLPQRKENKEDTWKFRRN